MTFTDEQQKDIMYILSNWYDTAQKKMERDGDSDGRFDIYDYMATEAADGLIYDIAEVVVNDTH